MTPVIDVVLKTTAFFQERGIPSARLDAELIVGHVLGLDRVKVYLNFDRPLTDVELDALRPLVRRRAAREPLAWVLGAKEFFGRDFGVRPGVLVPRPDTETLLEAFFAEEPAPSSEEPLYVVDVGSGTGCIGLTIALERPNVRLFAVDLSEDALACTRANVERHGLKERVAVLRGDALAPIPAARRIDWVVSNPPYIPSAEIAGLAPEVAKMEPKLALDGGADGLDVYRRLIPTAAARARKGVVVEVGAGQAAAVAALMTQAGLAAEAKKDLAGVERVVVGRR